jgi:hypothetical protein
VKTVRTLLLAAASGAALHAARGQSDGSFDLSWNTIDGGGGISSGSSVFGAFAVVGTAGQPDAGIMNSDGFSINGGFWGFVHNLPAQNTPALRITLAGSHVIISWPNPSPGFDLQETAALDNSMSIWNNVGQPPAVVSSEKQVTLPPTDASRFFRLRKP